MTYPAEVAQWTDVFGVTAADAVMTSVKPAGATDTWQRTSYRDSAGAVVVEANSGPSNVPHDLTPRGLWSDVIRFFGLDGSTPPVARDAGAEGTGGTGGRAGGGGSGVDAAAVSGAGGTPASGGATGAGGSGATGGAAPTEGTTGAGGKIGGAGGTVAGAGGRTAGTGGGSVAGSPASGSGGASSPATGGSSVSNGGGGCSVAGDLGRRSVPAILIALLLLLGLLARRSRRAMGRRSA